MKIRSQITGRNASGITLVEVLVAAALMVVTGGLLLYGFGVMNFRAMYARNMTGGADVLRGLTEMALTLPYDGYGSTSDVENTVLARPSGSGLTLANSYSNPSSYSLVNTTFTLGGSTPGDYTTYNNVPVYVGRDPVVARTVSGDPLLQPLVTGNVTRAIAPVTAPIVVSGDGATATNLEIVNVRFTVNYTYNGRNRTLTMATFRAPTK